MVKFDPAAVNAAVTPNRYDVVTLGSEPSAPTISLPFFPALSADVLLKKVALRAALSAIAPHADSVSTRAIFDALSHRIPIDLHAIDAECNHICGNVRSALLTPGHPNVTHRATDFFNWKGENIHAYLEIKDRQKSAKLRQHCLSYVAISVSTPDLSEFHPALAVLGNVSSDFILQLPTSVDSHSAAADTITPRQLDDTTDPPDEDEEPADKTPTTTTNPRIPSSMGSAITASSNTTFPNYYGDFTFLDSDTAFIREFGTANPPTYSRAPMGLGIGPQAFLKLQQSENFTTLSRRCYFTCFSALVEHDYVGATISNESATQAVFHKLRQLTSSRFDQTSRKKSYHTPLQMYQDFGSFIPSLDTSCPSAISAWPSSLAQQFLNNLSAELQDSLYKGKHAHTIKDHASLTTLSDQLRELRNLADAAQIIHDEHSLMRNLCRNQVSSFLATHTSPAPNPKPILKTSSYPKTTTFASPAESVLQQYAKESSRNPVTDSDDDYPTDPYSDTKYKSRYPRSFRGCYRCGKAHPRLSSGERESCPLRADTSTRAQFFRDYFAHHPDKRRFYDNGEPVQRDAHDRIIYPPPTPKASVNITQPHDTDPNVSDSDNEPPQKQARLPNPNRPVKQLVIGVQSFHFSPKPATRPIPVAITPTLPTITVSLGEHRSSNITNLVTLLDTCASLNSGLYSFHKQFATDHPNCVHSFIEFNDSTQPFEPVRLSGAVRDPDSFAPSEFHGLLRAVVTYILPYAFSDGSPVHLAIALGDDVSVDTIVGWPFCHAVHGVIDCLSNIFYARLLETEFPIVLRPPSASTGPTAATTSASTQFPRTNPRPKIDNRPAWMTKQPLPPTPSTESALHHLSGSTDTSLSAFITAYQNTLSPDF